MSFTDPSTGEIIPITDEEIRSRYERELICLTSCETVFFGLDGDPCPGCGADIPDGTASHPLADGYRGSTGYNHDDG